MYRILHIPSAKLVLNQIKYKSILYTCGPTELDFLFCSKASAERYISNAKSYAFRVNDNGISMYEAENYHLSYIIPLHNKRHEFEVVEFTPGDDNE